MTGATSASLLTVDETSSDDFGADEYARAVLNILEDFAAEKLRLEEMQSAVLNILDDAAEEKVRLEGMQSAVLNILDDLGVEKERLEETQREILRSEQAIRSSLQEKEVLLKEVHHRVKNNLQVISSLLRLQARSLMDSAARDIFTESQNRVQSIALVHEKLYGSSNLSEIDFNDYVSTLLENLLSSSDAATRGITSTPEVNEVPVPIDLAIPCGLIVNELVTNALKHAFPNGRSGNLSVSLRRVEPEMLELVVGDDGVGLPEGLDPRKSRSLGLRLVFTFAQQIRAETIVDRDKGTAFRLRFPDAKGTR